MPIYEYECTSCNNTIEVLHSMSETYGGSCTKCNRINWQRLVSKSDFHLKGGGWYKDGYVKKTQTNEN